MKRSQVNEIIRASDAFIRSFGFTLPPFAYWTPEEMRARRADIGGIVDARLGWEAHLRVNGAVGIRLGR